MNGRFPQALRLLSVLVAWGWTWGQSPVRGIQTAELATILATVKAPPDAIATKYLSGGVVALPPYGDKIPPFAAADGTAITCTRPPDNVLDDPESEGVSAAFSTLVQALVDRGTTVAEKEGAVFPAASTPVALEYLSYRICLEYGHDVVDQATYDEWVGQVEPGLRARVKPPT